MPLMYRTTRTVSITGMPSVMQATVFMPASKASTMASAAKGGGTKISETLAAVSATACSTVLNTGTTSSNVVPSSPRGNASHQVGAVLLAPPGVGAPLPSGDTLYQ